jgi:hypothetical protein
MTDELRLVVATAKHLHKSVRGLTLYHQRNGTPLGYDTVNTLSGYVRYVRQASKMRTYTTSGLKRRQMQKHKGLTVKRCLATPQNRRTAAT